jgi:hypothetical protein
MLTQEASDYGNGEAVVPVMAFAQCSPELLMLK